MHPRICFTVLESVKGSVLETGHFPISEIFPGMRFATVIAEHDFERKVNQVRGFLTNGHRVEARILQSRGTAEDVLDLALRIVAEVRDIAKPEYFEARSGDRIRMVRNTFPSLDACVTYCLYLLHLQFSTFLPIHLSIYLSANPTALNSTKQRNPPPTQFHLTQCSLYTVESCRISIYIYICAMQLCSHVFDTRLPS